MSRSSVAVVIVNYDTSHLVLSGLQALAAERSSVDDLRVVVVDNASTDGSADVINLSILAEGWADWVQCLALDENRGFAAGNNAGVWHARRWKDFEPSYFFFLNPDARVCPGAVAELVRVSETKSHASILGAQLTNEDGSVRASAFRFPGVVSEFARGAGIGFLEKLLPCSNIVLKPQDSQPVRADWVSGAAFMVPASVWRRLGEMDDRYFLYYEEADYQRRAAKKGFTSWSVPTARVIHIAGASTGIVGGNSRGRPMPDYWYHSWHRYFVMGKGRLLGVVCAVAWLAGRLLRLARARVNGRVREAVQTDGHTIARFWRIAVKAKPPENMGRTAGRAAPPLPDGAVNRNPSDIDFWALLLEDFRTHDSDWSSQGFWSVAVHRFGNWRMSVWPRPLRYPLTLIYRVLRKACQLLCGIKLDYTVTLGRRVKLEHFGGMVLGARSIGNDVVIRQNTTLGVRNMYDLNAKPIIGSRVEIGAGAVIVGHVHIGDDAVIGSNAVVTFDVPEAGRVRAPRSEMRLVGPLEASLPDAGGVEPEATDGRIVALPALPIQRPKHPAAAHAYFAVSDSRGA